MDPIEQLRQSFLIEADELVIAAESSLTNLRPGSEGADDVNSAFRAIHSIKGGAGAFGFQSLVPLSHALEAALDQLRGRKNIDVDSVPVNLFLRGVDAISQGLACSKTGGAQQNFDALIAELGEYAGRAKAVPVDSESNNKFVDATKPAAHKQCHVHLALHPDQEMFKRIVEPRHLLQRLESFGALTIKFDLSALPDIDAIDPFKCYLRIHCQIDTETAIESIKDICLQSYDETEFTLAQGDIKPHSKAVDVETRAPDAAPSNASLTPALQSAATLGLPPGRAATTTIRVDLDRIDRLMNLVGEIVITQSILTDQINRLSTTESAKLAEGIEILSRQMRELQDNVMAVRAQPVRTVFQRIPRMVRDLSQTLQKDVRVEMNGESTEIDKTIIEELTDPMIHMIRNSMDHGIEHAAERVAAGKDEVGLIKVSAEQKNGRIFITIEDDGQGINRERVLQKALEAGIVSEAASLNPMEIDNLIFHPGLSTAASVTDVSGRGVGMDVVRRNVEALGGRIFVESNPGHGSKFCLALPLTLAVLEGMIVRSGDLRIVIPITAIVETCLPRDHLTEVMPNGLKIMKFRNELALLYDMSEVMGRAPTSDDKIIVVVEDENAKISCLAVDEIIGQQQVVVKSLEANYKRIPCASAATILGDGLVALILNVNALNASGLSVDTISPFSAAA